MAENLLTSGVVLPQMGRFDLKGVWSQSSSWVEMVSSSPHRRPSSGTSRTQPGVAKTRIQTHECNCSRAHAQSRWRRLGHPGHLRELGAGMGAQPRHQAPGLGWTLTTSVSSALHGSAPHQGPFYLLPGQEARSGAEDALRLGSPQCGRAHRTVRQTLSLTHARDHYHSVMASPRQKKAHRADTKAGWLAQGLCGQILSVPLASL